MSDLNKKRFDFDPASVDFSKGDGLVPAVIQDHSTSRVLMLGYMNRESLNATLDSGLVTFFSRSRQSLWCKGETSGNTLQLESIQLDCDGDALLVKARPCGPTCHTGAVSCFDKEPLPQTMAKEFPEAPISVLADLWGTIVARSESGDPASSYTAKLLAAGTRRQAQKVGEEGVEVALAATAQDAPALLGEAADLLYHLLVLLRGRGLTLGQVCAVLASRA